MHSRTRRWTTRSLVALGGAIVIAGTMSMAPASAAVLGNWSRSTTGAAGSGKIEVKNGYIYNTLSIKDTKADGDCAYVTTEWQHHNGLLGLWYKSDSERTTQCGNGITLFTSVRRSINSIDAPLSDKLRVKVTVCRNVNNAGDNCSDSYLSPSYEL